MSLPGDLKLGWFAKKFVHRLNDQSTIWDAIELMNDLNIRHIPVIKGFKINGILNPSSLMTVLEGYTDPSTFNQQLNRDELLSQNYITVKYDTSILEIAKLLAKLHGSVALLMNDGMIDGIFTEFDLIKYDYLWSEIGDIQITIDNPIGINIDEFNTIPTNSTIQQALETMLLLEMENIGVIDEHTKILKSAISFIDIIHYLMYNYKNLNNNIEYLLEDTITTIFPTPGLYVKEPILLSELRQQMIDSRVYFTVLLDEEAYPTKIISIHDLVEIYAEHYQFLD